MNKALYQPLYSPWLDQSFEQHYKFAEAQSLVSRDRCFVLERLLWNSLRVPGHVFECGVYKGGTAAMLAAILETASSDKELHLFDSFEGLPACDEEKDWHKQGDFKDTTLELAQRVVSRAGRAVRWHVGWMPETFTCDDWATVGSAVAFAHIDVDIYKSIIDCLDWIWPRLSLGGVIVFDDYGFPTCPGAREAVDDFFAVRPAFPLCLHTGQAVVFKSINNHY